MGGMVSVRGKRRLYGAVRDCPLAVKQGSFESVGNRWRVVRDGLKAVIEALPMDVRGYESELQACWAYAAFQVERHEAEAGGEWLIPF